MSRDPELIHPVKWGDGQQQPGMELRDYFAAIMLPEIFRNACAGVHPFEPIKLAIIAYRYGDAMIKARYMDVTIPKPESDV